MKSLWREILEFYAGMLWAIVKMVVYAVAIVTAYFFAKGYL